MPGKKLVKVFEEACGSVIPANRCEVPAAGKTLVTTDGGQTQSSPVIATPTITFNVEVVAAAGASGGDATSISIPAFGIVHATGADATKGIKLPAAAAGKVYMIKNADAANAILKVYPATGDGINAITVGDPISMAAKTCAIFGAIDGTTWFTSPLLPS